MTEYILLAVVLFILLKRVQFLLIERLFHLALKTKCAKLTFCFEFNNPENSERKLLIGFQAPTATGDVPGEICNTNQISNFTIISDGQILPYKLKAAECEDCELKEPKEFSFSQFESGVFVYLFEVTFKPGINKINHSYSFPASSDVVFDQLYNYILTNGSKMVRRNNKKLNSTF